jgi:putative oxidoreductase
MKQRYGFTPTMNFFTGTMKLPWIIALMIIIAEFFCSIGLIIGFGSRLCAALFIIIMCGAIITTNYQYGFFMNWFGNQQGGF